MLIKKFAGAALLALLLPVAACGGKKGSLQLDIVTPTGDDPFMGASQVRVTIATKIQTAALNSLGSFSMSIDFKPLKDPTPVLVEVLDNNGNAIASGITPALALVAGTDTEVAVWVARHNTIRGAKAVLPAARTDFAAIPVTGLGALMVGGRLATGGPTTDSIIYNIFTHAVITSTPANAARAGAVGIGSTTLAQGAVFGGASSGEIGAFDMPLATAELFDPTVGSGLWSAMPVETTDARSYPNLVVLGSGVGLVTGGLSATGTPLSSAVFIQTAGTASVTAIPAPGMTTARYGHAGTAVTFPTGAGALLFGGTMASTSPVCEQIIGQTFSAFDCGTVTSRNFATATTLTDGSVLILGGMDVATNTVAASGIHIVPTTVPPTVTVFDNMLSAPRQHHTATLVNGNVLVCGGDDGNGTVQATCDIIASSLTTTTLPTLNPRTSGYAIPLETGPVLLVGGVGADGKPLAAIDVYTP